VWNNTAHVFELTEHGSLFYKNKQVHRLSFKACYFFITIIFFLICQEAVMYDVGEIDCHVGKAFQVVLEDALVCIH